MRGFKRWFFLLSLLVLFPASAYSAEFTAFGPKNYIRQSGSPVTVIEQFNVSDPSAAYTFKIYNGGLEDDAYEKVSSGYVKLNGVEIVNSNNFNQNINNLDVPVVLQASNTLEIELRGKPGGGVVVQITGIDNVPPQIVLDPLYSPTNIKNFTVTGSFIENNISTITVNGANAVIDDQNRRFS